MEKTVKVSVIMLAYNIEKYIEIAIKGVLSQKTDYPIELIIGEDRSTDRTYEICKRYQEKYPQLVTVIRHEKNLGLQRNYVETYKHCRGEYIAICDGDDYWFDRRKLQRITDFMDAHSQFAICFHRVINYYEEDGSKSLSNGGQKRITTISDLAKSNYITNSSSVFRRCYYPEMPEWFAKFTSCDYAQHLLNAQHGDIYYFSKPMAVYRKHGKGIWSEADMDKRLDCALTAREFLLDYFKDKRTDVYDGLRQAHANICLNLIRHYIGSGQTERMEEAEKRLLKYQPQWTLDDVKRQETLPPQQAGKMMKARFKKILTWGRETVSRYIPLPRIKNQKI